MSNNKPTDCMILTEFERALIDRFRRATASEQYFVCMNLELPQTQEGLRCLKQMSTLPPDKIDKMNSYKIKELNQKGYNIIG